LTGTKSLSLPETNSNNKEVSDMENYNTKLVKFAASSRNCILVMDVKAYKSIPINYKNSFVINCENIILARGCC